MNDAAIERLEAEATEVLGAMKELFREFEKRLGETVSAQRLASSEAAASAADARAVLRELLKRVEETADEQRQSLEMLRENWWFNIEQNAKASGAGMAQEFGEKIAAGIVIIVALGVNALTPRADGLSGKELQAAVAELVPCQVEKERHVCVRLDDKPRLSKLEGGTPIAVVRGL